MKFLKILMLIMAFIICDIVVIIFLYAITIYPIKNKYNGDGSVKKDMTHFCSYENKSEISNEQKEVLLYMLDNIDLYSKEQINLEKEARVKISINSRHKRVIGDITIYGTYNSLDDLKEAFKSFNINEEKFDDNKIYIINKNNCDVLINKTKDNEFMINFISKLPYEYNIHQIDNTSEDIVYYKKINEENRIYVNKKMNKAKIIFWLCFFVINVIFFIF